LFDWPRAKYSAKTTTTTIVRKEERIEVIGGAIELLDAEQNILEKLGTINVCVDPDWEPFEMMDKKGHYTGIGADLLHLVAQRVGINVTVLPTKDWDESVAFSKAGRCQVISFLNQSPYRDTWLLFTQPHFSDLMFL
jgi:hypothetical protein